MHVGAELAAVAVEVAAHACGIASVGLGHDDDLVARKLLDGGGDVGVRAVGVGGVEEAEAVVVVAVEEEAGEGIGAEAGLVGATAEADGAGSHGEARGADAGLAEDDFVVCADFLGKGLHGERGGGGVGCEPGGSQAFGGAAEKVSSQHAGHLTWELGYAGVLEGVATQ